MPRAHFSVGTPIDTVSYLLTNSGGSIMARVRGFGELEASIMDRLWNRDPDADTTVRDIFDELSTERHIAYTTVMSTMDNLHSKGWLSRERDGKAYRYRPTLTREEHSARLMLEALSGGGRSEAILSHFCGADRRGGIR